MPSAHRGARRLRVAGRRFDHRPAVGAEGLPPGHGELLRPRYTSQTCNACGHVARESRESQALFLCVACQHRDHADVNAAKNLRDTPQGIAVAARGGLPLGEPANREPQRDLLLVG
ncbi:zinc ribbon domain-containing protein [Streptosporangium subroseum]|uniref:zinc ribbon domain-containing protein n=1 Tax=Streptosporangium subroseum TaxID=106412 RepID=UPI00342F46F2